MPVCVLVQLQPGRVLIGRPLVHFPLCLVINLACDSYISKWGFLGSWRGLAVVLWRFINAPTLMEDEAWLFDGVRALSENHVSG
jgi:hypothetical protein